MPRALRFMICLLRLLKNQLHLLSCVCNNRLISSPILDVLNFNIELNTDTPYEDAHSDPNSQEFGMLAGPIEENVRCWFYVDC